MAHPIVATLLGQGLTILSNATIAKGKDWLKEKTGIDIDKASLSQEDILALRKFEMEHEEELIRLGMAERSMHLDDVQSSRRMQSSALEQDDKFSKRFVYYFTIFLTAAVVVYIGAITFTTIPEDNVRFADTILGFILGSVLAPVIVFFFGSSQGSKTKDDTLRSALTKMPNKE